MKKLFLVVAMTIFMVSATFAADTYSRDEKILPKAAVVTIANNFKSKVSLIKVEKTIGITTEYDVILTDGTEIEFDRDGNWQSVEVSSSNAVPSGFILDGISKYVSKNHPKTRIVGIERDGANFDVTLSDGINLVFNTAGEFMKYED